MALLANILGFSVFGLAARVGQLGIQKRNLLDSTSLHSLQIDSFNVRFYADPGGHLIAMGVFGYAGYWAYRWDQRAGVLLAEKRAEITERRRKQIAKAEGLAAAALADSE